MVPVILVNLREMKTKQVIVTLHTRGSSARSTTSSPTNRAIASVRREVINHVSGFGASAPRFREAAPPIIDTFYDLPSAFTVKVTKRCTSSFCGNRPRLFSPNKASPTPPCYDVPADVREDAKGSPASASFRYSSPRFVYPKPTTPPPYDIKLSPKSQGDVVSAAFRSKSPRFIYPKPPICDAMYDLPSCFKGREKPSNDSKVPVVTVFLRKE
jgi:hypothetical protein